VPLSPSVCHRGDDGGHTIDQRVRTEEKHQYSQGNDRIEQGDDAEEQRGHTA
jgi:hypothetical protein